MSDFPLQSFANYWNMWNETDLTLVREQLDQAVTDDFVFCDPLHFHVGRDALEANVREFRSERKRARFEVVSGFDHHHDRYRYEWQMLLGERVVVNGLDIATVQDDGLLCRIDGFFGPIPPA